ncbi:MAG: pyrroloquinoline quinone-dependent dehydrogenase [Vicinamibacterales bacterium]
MKRGIQAAAIAVAMFGATMWLAAAQAPAPAPAGQAPPQGQAPRRGGPPPAAQPAEPQGPLRTFRPVTDEMLRNPSPNDWLMWRGNFASWGHSALDQINRNNVRNLSLVWTRSLAPGVQEGTPLVYNGTLFFPNPLDVIQAIDAQTGDILWQYRRQLPDDLQKYFPTPTTNRNLAIYDNLILDTSADNFAFALNAQTGQLVWETKILDYQKGAQHTSGPIVANGKMISGRGCEPEGGPDACVILAHDARSGKELWRTRLIPAPGEPGFETWGDVPFEQRIHVGSWMVPSFDPELNLVFVGTSVTSPAPKYLLGGNDNEHLYHNSTLAINADTGKIVWHYQHLVDHWDLDHPFERMVVTTAVAPDRADVQWISPNVRAGDRRKVITGIPGKSGVMYTLDARTGEFLWARPTVFQNIIRTIDADGKVQINPEVLFTAQGQERFVCPGTGGGRNWPSGAYDPATNTMFFPLQNGCTNVTALLDKPSPQSLYGIRMQGVPSTAPNVQRGTVQAFSAETGRTLWTYGQAGDTTSLLTTAGGLLFGGDQVGRFRAFDSSTGKVLWEVNLGSPVTGYPIAYSINGRQYIAVSGGGGLGAARGAAGRGGTIGNNLYVFALPPQ